MSLWTSHRMAFLLCYKVLGFPWQTRNVSCPDRSLFFIVCLHRSTLFGVNSSGLDDADLTRLYAATSLMQIDDSIMRWSFLVLWSACSCHAIWIANTNGVICTVENSTATARWRSTTRRTAVCSTSIMWVQTLQDVSAVMLFGLLQFIRQHNNSEH